MPKLLFARPPLDAVEERKIRKLAGARHAPADWIRRAQIIALSWDGLRVPAIAAALGCSSKAVRHRLARFSADGLDGLGDRPGAGRKPRIGQAQRSQLIALVASPPPGRGVRDGTGELVAADPAGAAVWTLDALTAAARAAGIDIARSPVRRILLAEGVRWRRPRSEAASADPEFVPQEPGSSSATRTRRRTPRSLPPTSSPPVMPRIFDPPAGWSPDGHRPKAPLTYRRGPDKTWIYGGLRIGDGQAVTCCAPSRNSTSWRAFLARLERGQPDWDDRGDHRQPVQSFEPGHPGLAGRSSAHRAGVHPERGLL